jgi:hypothetical protein
MAVINNKAYDGGTIEVSVTGIGTFTGIEAINYGISKETTKIKGAGNRDVDRTPGRHSADDGSMDIWLTQHESWVAQAGGEHEWLDSEFDVTVSYRVEGNPLIVKKLLRCTPLNAGRAHSFGGSENLIVTVNFSVMDIETGS